jgi:ABC-type transporter Mla MlaB component
MELTITNYNNFFEISGILDKSNVFEFQEAFRNIFDKIEDVTISIKGLQSIDRYGVNAIAKLHNESITKAKRLSIIGLGCKELYDHFKSEAAA